MMTQQTVQPSLSKCKYVIAATQIVAKRTREYGHPGIRIVFYCDDWAD